MKKLLVSLAVTLGLVAAGAAVAPPSQARAVWDTTQVSLTRTVSPAPHPVNLRVGKHATYDRVVIDLRGKIPGYRIGYVSKLVYDASGRPVPLVGKRFLAVTLEPATAHTAKGTSTYSGPLLATYGWATLRGVALTGDYERVVSFGIAVSKHATFRVFTLHSPNRIVIDLHH